MRRIAVLAALAISGCSFSLPMEAIFVNSQLAFNAKNQDPACVDDFAILDRSGRIMWRVEGEYQPRPCQNSLPVIYGIRPHSTKQTVKPHRLKAGELYYISGSAGGSLYGSFKLRKIIAIDNDTELGRTAPLYLTPNNILKNAK